MKRKNLDSQIKNLEKRMKNKNCGVGVVINRAGGWVLYHNGAERDFPTEDAAVEFFYRTASQDAVLILW